MTSANNDIKALIAKQVLPHSEPNPVATVSLMLKSSQASPPMRNASDLKYSSLDGYYPSNQLIVPPVAASVEAQTAPQSLDITELLIRIRELASQALKNIRTAQAVDEPTCTSFAKLDRAISAIDCYYKELTLQVNRSSPAPARQSDSSVLQSHTMDAMYAQTTSALARAEIEQHAGKALLAQANQRPAFVIALLH